MVCDIIKALDEVGLESKQALIIILIALEKCEMHDAERSDLLRIQDIILERLITQGGRYKVVPVVDDVSFASGYFVSSLDYLTQPYTVHEHIHIRNGDTKLSEWYYTGANGLKYRHVILPEEYKDPGFLLNNSIISVRANNMAKLAAKRRKEVTRCEL
nr:MAG TPA: hypothetical protein [Caudoviricetes sp.]